MADAEQSLQIATYNIHFGHNLHTEDILASHALINQSSYQPVIFHFTADRDDALILSCIQENEFQYRLLGVMKYHFTIMRF